ncbi:MAG: DUF5915 domain-containing protein, partial [Bacteroidota bacterium]|nr:DUF5915 domain-containing protein [Bacteroidota bacterium]
EISEFEKSGLISLDANGENIEIAVNEVEFVSKDIPGWLVANDGKYTLAMDITISDELKQEGFARELINKIQNFRKELNFEVTDKISLAINTNSELKNSIDKYREYVASQTLTNTISFVEKDEINNSFGEFDINGIEAKIKIEKN